MFVLDGAAYDQKFVGDGNGRMGASGSGTGTGECSTGDGALDDCALLVNNKNQPLLGSSNTGSVDKDGRLLLQTTVGTQQQQSAPCMVLLILHLMLSPALLLPVANGQVLQRTAGVF